MSQCDHHHRKNFIGNLYFFQQNKFFSETIMSSPIALYDYANGKTLDELKAEIKATLTRLQRTGTPTRRSGLEKFT
jgi:hypothetical protein